MKVFFPVGIWSAAPGKLLVLLDLVCDYSRGPCACLLSPWLMRGLAVNLLWYIVFVKCLGKRGVWSLQWISGRSVFLGLGAWLLTDWSRVCVGGSVLRESLLCSCVFDPLIRLMLPPLEGGGGRGNYVSVLLCECFFLWVQVVPLRLWFCGGTFYTSLKTCTWSLVIIIYYYCLFFVNWLSLLQCRAQWEPAASVFIMIV